MTDRLDAILDGLGAGLPANIVLMRLLVEARSATEAEAAIARRGTDPAALALGRLLREHPTAFGTVRAVMAEADHGSDGTAGPERWAAVFDRLAHVAPEAGTALYALGSPGLLAATTDEVVACLRGWGLVAPDRRLLEIGCGIGRLTRALAPFVADALGLDVSTGMVAEATRRGRGVPRLGYARTSGRGLDGIADASVDLVLVADVMPYLVEAGLADIHVVEATRVLRPGGALAIFNWSYRGDPALDLREAATAFATAGLVPERLGTRDLALWDAVAFVARRPAAEG